MSARSPEERLRAACDTERIRQDLPDLVDEVVNADDLREWIAAAEDLIEVADLLRDQVEQWAEEGDRETRAEYRDEAALALQDVVDKLDDFLVWGPLPERTDHGRATWEGPTVDRHADNLAYIARMTHVDRLTGIVADADRLGGDEYVQLRRAALVRIDELTGGDQ